MKSIRQGGREYFMSQDGSLWHWDQQGQHLLTTEEALDTLSKVRSNAARRWELRVIKCQGRRYDEDDV